MNLKLRMTLLAGLLAVSSILCARLSPAGEEAAPEAPQTAAAVEEKPAKATIAPRVEATPAGETAETGAISGPLSYPSEVVPPLRVVAFREDGARWYSVEVFDSASYLLEGLPPGDYYVVAYLIDKDDVQGGFAGAYTLFVECGMSVECGDHSLIPVPVLPGSVTSGVHPGDWYAPEDAFPPDPASQ